MLLTIDRSKPFDPVSFLGQSGFKVAFQSIALRNVPAFDSSKMRLEYGMYNSNRGRPLFRSERVEWLNARGFVMPDGHVIETLKKHTACFPQEWAAAGLTIHLDGIALESSWDGRQFEIYMIYNKVQKMWEFPYLGPWAGRYPSLVIDP